MSQNDRGEMFTSGSIMTGLRHRTELVLLLLLAQGYVNKIKLLMKRLNR